MESKKRIAELDIVKGIAIVYVCMWHINELTGVNIYGSFFGSAFKRCGECIMFLFVFLSGYVFKSKGSIWIDIKNKVNQLLIPYLNFSAFFTVTYFIRYVLIAKMDIRLFLINTLSNFLACRFIDVPSLGSSSNVMRYAFIPYWYIAEILSAFVLFIIINKLVENRHIYVRMVTSILLLIVSGLLMYLDVGEFLKNTYSSQVSYFTIPVNITGFAGLLMLGTILRHYKLFDIDAHSKCITYVLFALCLVCTVVQYALYDNQYALQYGKWGQYGIWSIPITTITGFTLTYSLIFISHYLKRNEIIKRCLSFLGANSLDILMLHYGIAELICMIGGFWYPVYDISSYPTDDFAWWHFFIVVFFTAVSIGVYFTIKKYSNNRLTR